MREAERQQIKRLWRGLAASDKAFLSTRNVLVRRRDHQLSPTGWLAVVSLFGSAMIAVPRSFDDEINTVALARLDGSDVSSVEGIRQVFGEPVEFLGPSLLAYGRGSLGRSTGPVAGDVTVKVQGPLRVTHPLVAELVSRARRHEVVSSGLAGADSGLFVAVDAAGSPVSASGYLRIAQNIAHLSVVTATGARGNGFGRAASSAAIRHAASLGLMPQWRCVETNLAAVALANSLGLETVGRQFSFRLA